MIDFFNLLDPLSRCKERCPPEAFSGLPEDVIPHPFSRVREDERFSDYKSLLKLWTARAFLYRYEGKTPLCKKKIVLFTWVMASGLGDLGTQMMAASILKEAFPDLEIHLISLVEANEKIFFDHPVCPTHKVIYHGFQTAKIPSHLIELMKGASLVVQLPTIYPDWDMIVKQLEGGPEIISIGEYGFIDSDWFHPGTNHLCMGLHSLEQGLLLPKPLLANKEPFYFAYLFSERGYAIYLHTLLHQKKDIHIRVTHMLPLLKALKSESWSGYGLKEIVILDGKERSVLSINEGEKRVIIEKERAFVGPEQIQRWMAESQPFVGCRGDRSFSEVLVTKKPFFYDGPSHARPFLQDLLSIARGAFSHFPSLEEYLSFLLDHTTDPKELGKSFALLLSDASLIHSMKLFLTYIEEKFSFNRSLLNLVSQKTDHHFNPQKKREDHFVLERFLQGELELEELYRL